MTILYSQVLAVVIASLAPFCRFCRFPLFAGTEWAFISLALEIFGTFLVMKGSVLVAFPRLHSLLM